MLVSIPILGVCLSGLLRYVFGARRWILVRAHFEMACLQSSPDTDPLWLSELHPEISVRVILWILEDCNSIFGILFIML